MRADVRGRCYVVPVSVKNAVPLFRGVSCLDAVMPERILHLSQP